MRRSYSAMMLGSVLLSLVPGPISLVRAGEVAFVAATDGSQQVLGKVDVVTGVFTLIGDLSTPGYTVFGMEFGGDGQIYAIASSQANGSSPGEFFRIDPTTGASTDLGSLNFAPYAAAGNGTMYALDASAPSAGLYSIQPPSASSTFLGQVPFTSDGLAAVDSKGNFFAAGNGNGTLFEVNTATASTTQIGTTGIDSLYAGAFVGGTLYAFAPYGFGINQDIDTVIAIDTSNASFTVGPRITGFPNFYHSVVAATAYAVPEPSSLLLGLVGGLSLLVTGLLKRSQDR